MKPETWKPIAGYQGTFYVSSWGRVLNVKTRTLVAPYVHKSRSGSYLRVSLDGKKLMVHILVGEHHLPMKDDISKTQINHKDLNTLNPNVENLEWSTPGENQMHRRDNYTVLIGDQRLGVKKWQSKKSGKLSKRTGKQSENLQRKVPLLINLASPTPTLGPESLPSHIS